MLTEEKIEFHYGNKDKIEEFVITEDNFKIISR